MAYSTSARAAATTTTAAETDAALDAGATVVGAVVVVATEPLDDVIVMLEPKRPEVMINHVALEAPALMVVSRLALLTPLLARMP